MRRVKNALKLGQEAYFFMYDLSSQEGRQIYREYLAES